MRINHNIAALNTYRQLNSASSAQGKSMEKLSSGLRINKAGDDAAGLAISEKMRGQIRGLDMASKNAQDGISLISTAEGALNETHSILQRMRELATQSANDTNTDADRKEIQNEINQLTSEVNRIGNTTEFNTQKLLNVGGEEAVAVTQNTKGGVAGVVSAASQVTGSVAAGASSGTLTFTGAGSDGDSVTINGFTINLKTTAADTDGTDGNIDITIGVDKNATATAIAAAFNNAKAAGAPELQNISVSDDLAGALTFTDSTGSNAIATTATSADASFGAGTLTGGTPETRGEWNFRISTELSAVGDTIEVAGATFTAVAGDADASAGEFSITGDAEAQAKSLAAAINHTNSAISGRLTASVSGDKITLKEDAGQATGNAVVVSSTTTAAQGSYSFDLTQPLAGEKIKIDDVEFEFGDGTNGTIAIGADAAATAASLRTAIGSNATLSAKYTVGVATDDSITLTQKAGYEANKQTEVVTSSGDSEKAFTAKLQIGANQGQSFEVTINDMRGRALNISGSAGSTATSADGSVNASFTAVKNVTNGTNSTTVEAALDVSTHDKATNAVKILDDAINSVSAERSKLGSFQNRLEHTINNLGTSSENLTAAESRIRDVDMAKEMMNQTKNSILSQAAQAMLAQSNQMPQGVLQLLR